MNYKNTSNLRNWPLSWVSTPESHKPLSCYCRHRIISFFINFHFSSLFSSSSTPVAILVKKVLLICILNLHMASLHLYSLFLSFLTTLSFSLNSYFLSVTSLWTEGCFAKKMPLSSSFFSQDDCHSPAEPNRVSLLLFCLSSSRLNKGAPCRTWSSRRGLKNSHPSFSR